LGQAEAHPSPPGEGAWAETPWEALGPLQRERIQVAGRTFTLERPASTDTLLDHPAVFAAFARNEYIPYWTDLWPAARMLAAAILQHDWPAYLTQGPERPEVLEVGCGLGLAGLAAAACGLRVVLSDCDATALRLALGNARLNGLTEVRAMLLDWERPPAGWRVPVVFASDVIFESRHVAPLVRLLDELLLPDGECWLADQNRPAGGLFRQTLVARGFTYATTPSQAHASDAAGHAVLGTIYRIRRRQRRRGRA
jgi:predicted nicotinamide N-methyase